MKRLERGAAGRAVVRKTRTVPRCEQKAAGQHRCALPAGHGGECHYLYQPGLSARGRQCGLVCVVSHDNVLVKAAEAAKTVAKARRKRKRGA